MLFDTRKTDNNEGFQPEVDNSIKEAKATKGEKALYIFLSIITLGIYFFATHFPKKNELLRRMNEIQEASSLIQAAQKKRRAILLKMMDSLEGYAKHEKETLEQVTKYRSKISEANADKDLNEFNNNLAEATRAINVQIERYPELKADTMYLQFSSEIVMQEEEIYATIRNYNYKATSFNREIYTFYTVIVAEKLGIYNQPLFKATKEEMADVDTSRLSK
ncbi:LemA family protein [[Mycoplasma] anseris]|uniref:LemA family protein n=1 Tax=[Mycoplasma] anseris TaxID=92400 RepID=A0A2Z4NDL5_9BACT|nr:LemA family protein [[Mycoplasma] anseris]AWX69617.1 LemA family protein [[Mycoplasma] anseris]